MTTIYCPFKNCPGNDAMGDSTKEGICVKKEIELIICNFDYSKSIAYCPEYKE
jgi:hypothetical protein